MSSRLPARLAAASVAVALLALAAQPAVAEKADRFKPINIEADLPSRIDLLNQFTVWNGNVVVTKGTMVIRASRIEVRESADGYHKAVAFGTPSQHATFRQKRDVPDEYIVGDAERLEYDGKSDTVRFVGNASVRRLRGTETSDEISGNLVTYDSTTEVFNVTGGAPATAANPGGRVRATLTPKEGSAAAAEVARASSAAASTASSTPAAGLRTAPSLTVKP
ncbi:MAG: lipopolysaccharide transport periplasmic protein LptA [Caldimonas sp.]